MRAMTTPVRVRFAPAPTGSLHVGGVRTALFNWLFARHHAGTFVLRIEDTDIARSRQEWIDGIQSTLQWLGIDWDEGPVLQSSRTERYREAIAQLLAQGDAYECFDTPEELEAMNAAAKAAGRPPGYDGRGRDLTAEQRAVLAAEGRPRTVRFRTPDVGVSSFDDMVRGTVSVEWSTIADFVIERADGSTVFFLANAVDDADLAITHVIRGEDLLDSTHRVLAIRHALGIADRPHYAHLPLLVGADRGKLSKRHGAVAIEDFELRGYLPEALVNYLALLGWSAPDGREVLDLATLIELFDLDRVHHAAAFFDYAKLDWLNAEYVRSMALNELVERLEPLASEYFGKNVSGALLASAAALGQERSTTLRVLLDQSRFLFVNDADFEIAPESWEKIEATENVRELFEASVAHLEDCASRTSTCDRRSAASA
jgi:nondiscriminating glutamyl-tRNA synthetase